MHINEEKKEIVKTLIPKAVLLPLTPKATNSIKKKCDKQNLIPIFSFPFSMGREARMQYIDGEIIINERHKLGHEPNNDIYLIDDEQFLQISREHCKIIEKNEDYFLIDRGSACGCNVNGYQIGGNDCSGELPLCDGDILTLGTDESLYQFKFLLLEQNYK